MLGLGCPPPDGVGMMNWGVPERRSRIRDWLSRELGAADVNVECRAFSHDSRPL
jgi:hypothetical protein